MHRIVVVFVTAVLTFVALGACEPTPPPEGTAGLVTSAVEIDALPVTGAAWEAVQKAARGSWGTPNLGDNNSTHDTSVMAGAIVSVRLDDAQLVGKVRAALDSVMVCDCYARALEASRNIPAYVVAADLVGLPSEQDQRFRSFLAGLRTKPLDGHSGGDSIRETALYSGNNWGTMARAAVVAIDLYLDDRADLAAVADTHRAWLGEKVANELAYSSTRWHTVPKTGVNRRGAEIGGCSVDGVIPEDQRRTGEPTCPAPEGSYPWEALQGAVLTGVMLDRAGIVPFNAGDSALVRAATWLTYTNSNPASGDDKGTPWMLNRHGGSNLPASTPTSPAKNAAWLDYLYG